MPSTPLRTTLAAVAVCSAALAAATPAAHAACASAPLNSSFADPVGDGESGLAPEAHALTVSVDGSCQLTVGYGLVDQSNLISGETLLWFVDVDGNASTGSTAYPGADIGVARSAGAAIVSRYSTTTGAFGGAVSTPTVGTLGARLDVPAFVGLGSRVMTIAGSTAWRSSSSGNSYYDWVPNIPAPAFPFSVALSEPAPPTPPAPVTPQAPTSPATPLAPTAPPAGRPGASTSPTPETTCVVPRTRKLPLRKAKARIRKGGCAPGRVVHRYSGTVKKGLVIELDATAGDEFEGGEKLEITVSKGPRPKKARRAANADSDVTELLSALNATPRAAHDHGPRSS